MPGKAFISIRLDMEAIDALQVWEVWASVGGVGGRAGCRLSCLVPLGQLPTANCPILKPPYSLAFTRDDTA